MKSYLKKDPWKVIEDKFHAEHNQITESIFSIGNARMGQRGYLEEGYSGHTLLGNYLAGIYYPDKTRVGWWKNGYPEYFAKVLNNCNWARLDIHINDQQLDLATCKIQSFYRELDMRSGLLSRQCEVQLQDGTVIEISSKRFYALFNKDLAVLNYSIKIIEGEGKISIKSLADFDIRNSDSNYDENFWEDHTSSQSGDIAYVQATTKKTGFVVGTGINTYISKNEQNITLEAIQPNHAISGQKMDESFSQGDVFSLNKYAVIKSSFYNDVNNIQAAIIEEAKNFGANDFEDLLQQQIIAWKSKWDHADIIIEGDVSAQQGIRFNIFHLNQTYDGKDDRLNIGPKGFTGEKYGGSTYWDTEAYCLPFYLFTAPQEVSRNLLIYRYKHLEKAIENAEKLGFNKGAALYPMVTINGEECHNEWEITFEEIHRNGAIAYAIYDYIRFTNDKNYIPEYGLEVLIGIARFWAQRVNYSNAKNAYVILGVTGPNEYENNINNNWYTNLMAQWCLKYAIEMLDLCEKEYKEDHNRITRKTSLEPSEIKHWKEVIDKMYFPKDETLNIFLQQDGFLDKEIIPVSELDPSHLPLNQKWSWDRILRSCYIKQADTLQGLYFFEDHYDLDTIKRNFDFYEPITVHESSLSPCVHSILACRLGYEEKAYEMYLRTSRLDLDDYNNDTEDGLHITSMAGTHMSVVKGLAGIKIEDNQIHISPLLPSDWTSLQFKFTFRNQPIELRIHTDFTEIINLSNNDLTINFKNQQTQISKESQIKITHD